MADMSDISCHTDEKVEKNLQQKILKVPLDFTRASD